MTTAEAAQALELDRSRVLQLIRAGRLKSEKRGRDHWIEPEEIARFRALPRQPGWQKGKARRGREVYELYYNIGRPQASQKTTPDRTVVEGERALKVLLDVAKTYKNQWKIIRVSDGEVLYQSDEALRPDYHG